MNIRIGGLILVFLATMIMGGCQVNQPVQQQEQKDVMSQDEQADGQKDMAVAVAVVDSNAETAEGQIDEEPAVVSDTAPRYTIYSAEEYAELKGNKPFVLFFHANWCPICKRMEKDINEDLVNYPEGTVILQTDYDTETELKKEFNINIQSTVVVLDADGNEVYRATDPALDDFKAAITRSLEIS